MKGRFFYEHFSTFFCVGPGSEFSYKRRFLSRKEGFSTKGSYLWGPGSEFSYKRVPYSMM